MNAEKMWSVSDVNAAMREIIENSLMPFWLQAEVGTVSIHSSGHVYLVLKDNRSQVKAVFFSGAAQARALKLQPGVKVEVFGKLTVYEVRGEYQFTIRVMRPVGMGDLQRKFEELRAKLESEGLFALDRKRPIPPLPRRIGVVTSPDGAAIRDFLQIINRRFPRVNVRIYPAPVQGAGSEEWLARGVEFFNRCRGVDVIVVTRGGGSMEDLWPFNAEVLARAIAVSGIPVISAVGHEIDYTISDFVADLRAPTPSAAAEMVIGRQEEFQERVQRSIRNLQQTVDHAVERWWRRLENASGSYVFREPVHLARQKRQQVEELRGQLTAALRDKTMRVRSGLALRTAQLDSLRPELRLAEYRRRHGDLQRRLLRAGCDELTRRRSELAHCAAQLQALSPYGVLRRGYALLTAKDDGRVIGSARIEVGTPLVARVADGVIDVTVSGSEVTGLDKCR